MSDVLKPSQSSSDAKTAYLAQATDVDPAETQEWIDSLEYVINSKGEERAQYLLSILEARARNEGVDIAIKSNTPYINTIHVDDQPAFPGNREIERRIAFEGDVLRRKSIETHAMMKRRIIGDSGDR